MLPLSFIFFTKCCHSYFLPLSHFFCWVNFRIVVFETPKG